LECFNETLAQILARHATVVETMAQGVIEMKEAKVLGSSNSETDRHMQKCVQYFLDRFYLNRIGLRMLINQHMHMFTDLKSDGNHVGAIDKLCDVQSIAEDAYHDARFLCEDHYMTAPECTFDCRNPYDKTPSESRITMTYVPTHLHHMLFEILKNSLRAVVERHEGKSELPKINVLICKGRSDVTIKVSDQGGGIRRSEIGKLFSYTYSSAPRPEQDEKTPMAGYGYGLPLSHLYARYFNGDLWLNSVDGYGTDAMLCLKLFPCDASELLPVYNKTSLLKYTQASHISDWSDPQYNRDTASKRSTVGGY
jgi:pyruvate dehydrogenase kinase 2/3/4